MNKVKSALRLVLIMSLIMHIPQIGFTQIVGGVNAVIGAKDKLDERKLQKSPAKELILESQEQIVLLDKFANKDAQYLRGEGKLGKYIESYEGLSQNKQLIAEKDPKWKLKDIEEALERNKPSYDKIVASRDDWERRSSAFKAMDKELATAQQEFEKAYKAADGQSFQNYAKSMWNDSFRNKLKEAQKIEDEYNKDKTDNDRFNNFEQESKKLMKGLIFFENKLDLRNKGSVMSVYVGKININKVEEMKWVRSYTDLMSNRDRIQGLLIFLPEDEQLKEYSARVEKVKESVEKEIDKIVVSEFHRTHMNQIFFSDHIVEFGNESEADFKTKFDLGQPIYATVYLGYSIDPEWIHDVKDEWLYIFADDSDEQFGGQGKSYRADVSKSKQGVFQFLLFPGIDKMTNIQQNGPDLVRLFHLIDDLKGEEGDQKKITLKMNGKKGWNDRQGTFQLSLTGMDKYFTQLESAKKSAMLESVTMRDEPSVNSDAASKARAMLEKDGHKVVKVKCYQEWYYEKYDYTGVIKYRYVNDMQAVCKDKNGQCYLLYLGLQQDKNGSSYGPVKIVYQYRETINGVTIPSRDNNGYNMNCSNVH